MRPLHGISKEGLGARVERTEVWALRAERIRLASKGYTFRSQNVYVSSVKRIRLGQVPNLPHQGAELRRFSLDE